LRQYAGYAARGHPGVSIQAQWKFSEDVVWIVRRLLREELEPDWLQGAMRSELATMPGNDAEVLTIREGATVLRCSKAHVQNLLAGKVKDAPAVPAALAVLRQSDA
jgi:hypothetical protein